MTTEWEYKYSITLRISWNNRPRWAQNGKEIVTTENIGIGIVRAVMEHGALESVRVECIELASEELRREKAEENAREMMAENKRVRGDD